MKTASVSVIIPTYNRPAYLEQAVSSVLAQTVRPCEILIIDDGSADEYRLEIDRIGALHPMIHVHRFPENRGRSTARNMGIAVAQGEFLVFLDDDDLLHPCYFESSLEYFKENPATQAVICRGKSFGIKRPWNPLRLGVLIFECGGVDSEHLRPFLPKSILDMTDLCSNPVTSMMMSSLPINSVLIRNDALNGTIFPP
ncbi:MAG: glycosyltransferase [Verrucomicrobia bacterium]|nr:glycosyltransferase [Verrucomicrobiota bacterium]MBU1734223.1 glycosyltransferase [Verrucomicrobiota bacterium]MBU1855761.1 glycosyltransferase [Verrucomicrobiota bacterium]